MGRFRKKPVIVEAHRWKMNGDHPEDGGWKTEGQVVRYFRHPAYTGAETCQRCPRILHHHGWIDTLEGGHRVCPGDWIVTGVQGERYPVKPDIFALTYEEASDG